MKDGLEPQSEVMELDDQKYGRYSTSTRDSDDAAVKKIGVKPTVPRTLDRLIGLIGLNSSVVAPWPGFYFISVLNLANGGTAGLMVGTLVAAFFMWFVYMSLAEKIRRYPTAGGQYHWVAALAPPSCRRFLSFFCCCILTFTWLSYLASGVWLFGLDIAAIVVIQTGEYQTWYTFTAAACICVFACIVNVTWGKHMNYPETLVVIVHIVAFLLLVGLLSFANASGTLTPSFTFSSQVGWPKGFAVCLSIQYIVAVFAGFDCAAHVAEDTVNASERLPKSLLWSVAANGVSCIIIGILICLCAGDSDYLFSAKASPFYASGHPLGPIVQLTYNATRENKAAASSVFGLIAVILVMAAINTTAAASRMVFSFIRDDRNPVVHKIMAIDLEREQVPRITIALVAFSPLVYLWINFLTAVGFQAIISQVTLSLTTTYIMAIGCSLYSRIYHPDQLGRSYNGVFQLGTFWGSIIDGVSLVFLAFMWCLTWFPYFAVVDVPAKINYAPIIIAGVVIIGVVYYVVYAHKHYHNPSPHEIEGRRDGRED